MFSFPINVVPSATKFFESRLKKAKVVRLEVYLETASLPRISIAEILPFYSLQPCGGS